MDYLGGCEDTLPETIEDIDIQNLSDQEALRLLLATHKFIFHKSIGTASPYDCIFYRDLRKHFHLPDPWEDDIDDFPLPSMEEQEKILRGGERVQQLYLTNDT